MDEVREYNMLKFIELKVHVCFGICYSRIEILISKFQLLFFRSCKFFIQSILAEL